MRETCDTCRWYEEPRDAWDFGLCHRYPPSVPCLETVVLHDRPRVERLAPVEERGVALTEHPLVIPDGWCGEWAPADLAAYVDGE